MSSRRLLLAPLLLALALTARGEEPARGVLTRAAALAAARALRFSPAEIDGRPAAVTLEYRFRFDAPPPAPDPALAARTALDPALASSTWPAVDLAGFEACRDGVCAPASVGGTPLPPARLAVPAGLTFPAAGAERILGVQAVVLAFALDATPDELVAGVGTACPAGDVAGNLAALWASREHVLSTKRVVIRGPDAPDAPNRDPGWEGSSPAP